MFNTTKTPRIITTIITKNISGNELDLGRKKLSLPRSFFMQIEKLLTFWVSSFFSAFCSVEH